MPARTLRETYLARHDALKRGRASWDSHWDDLASFVKPRRQRATGSEVNRGTKRNDSIIHGAATRAHRTANAGMQAGVSSPARPWFRLAPPDPELAEYAPVRDWTHVVEQRMRDWIFLRSNWYRGSYTCYGDLLLFGTHAQFQEEDARSILRVYPLPLRSYCLAADGTGRVNTLYRDVSMTAGQMAERFGLDRCSRRVRQAIDDNRPDDWIELVHVVEPNPDRILGRAGPEGMKFRSTWFEADTSDGGDADGMLAVGGYEDFPVAAPRWETTGEDIYGSSPGMDALADVKELQHHAKRKAQIVDKIVTPPMVGPSALKQQFAGLRPGDTTYIDGAGADRAFRPAHEITPNAIDFVRQDMQDCQRAINEDFFASLWQMISADQRAQRATAEEIRAEQEEKLVLLGPALDNVQGEFLAPSIDRAFALGVRARLFPPPPQELQGQDLRVEYLSIIAQAQKLLGLGSVQRLLNTVDGLARLQASTGARVTVTDKLDFDQTVDVVADNLGTPPAIVRADDAVGRLRAARAKEEAQAKQMAQAQAAADTAKTLGTTPMGGGDTALDKLAADMSPLAAAGAGGGP